MTRPSVHAVGMPRHVAAPLPADRAAEARDRVEIAPTLEKAADFPVHLLPPIVADAVAALEHHIQAPRGLCAHALLGAAALAAQAHADVAVPGLPGPRPLSLYLLAVADSGERKSGCDTRALAGVAEVERHWQIEHEAEMATYRVARTAYEAQKAVLCRKSGMTFLERSAALEALREPVEPLWPQLRITEATIEGLWNVLAHNRGSAGVFTAEGGQFLGGHGMSDDAKVRTITGLSSFWDGAPAQRIRAKEAAVLSGRRVSISLAVQPVIAARILGDPLSREQGFTARFLVIWPDSLIGHHKIRATRPREDARLLAFEARCRSLLLHPLPTREGTRNELDVPALHLDDEAWQVWQRTAQAIEDDCRADGKWHPVRATAVKMAENMARIAGVLALVQDPALLDDMENATIPGSIMEAACGIGLFYLNEALRLTGYRIASVEQAEQAELAHWLTTKWPHPAISPTVLQQRCPGNLRSLGAAALRQHIDALVAAGVLHAAGAGEVDGHAFRETFIIERGSPPRAARVQ